MDYMNIREAAEKWGISPRSVQHYCTSGRIEGALKFSGSWAIPQDAKKPADPRKKSDTDTADDKPSPTAIQIAPGLSISMPMPLLNTAFTLGDAKKSAEQIEDENLRNIAMCEYYYFSGQAQKASDLSEAYLTNEDLGLKLSACWLHAYANLALDKIQNARKAMSIINETLSHVNENTPPYLKTLSVVVSISASVLLHLPLKHEMPPLKDFISALPPGLRLFALYVQAHYAYINREYAASAGIAETALALEEQVYPIPTIYLHLVATMDYMSLKRPDKAKEHILAAWELAKPDDLIEPLGEHHGLVGGMLEATLKKDFPEDFKRIIAITYKFSAGWRKIHNPDTGRTVADNLTTTEFAVAMLAARGWTNKEIAAHLGISVNTVNTFVAVALQKLNISQRKELGQFMLH